MQIIGINEFMPDQSDGLLGERFESLAIRERPVTVVAFFTQFARVDLHPGVEIDRQFVHVRCNVEDESPCVLCDLGDPRKSYHVTPVYSVAEAVVRALVISDAHQPHSLGPQFKDELLKGDLDKRFLSITRTGSKYMITSLPAKPGQDMGDLVIKKFLKDLENGKVRFEDAIAHYSGDSIFEVETIRRDAEARGLDRSRYSAKAR